MLKKLWAMLPYPITHLHECMNTAPELHNFVIGLGIPACKIWRVKPILYDREEKHYFVAGVLISTVALLMSIGAFIVLIIRIT